MRNAAVLVFSFALSVLLHVAMLSKFGSGLQIHRTWKQPSSDSLFQNGNGIRFTVHSSSYLPGVQSTTNTPLNQRQPASVPEAENDSKENRQPQVPSVGAPFGHDESKYLTSDKLSTRAAPVVEWVIQRNALPKNQLVALRFTIWVASNGTIDYVAPYGQDRTEVWTTEALASLAQTHMEPATLNDQAVASTMTVEILIDNTTD